jgi:predicted AlkP superfamily phosphohydrolase/phosphomutase
LKKNVIVIGLDGFESKVVEPLLLAGRLPNLSKLVDHGGYSHVRTTYPAQTPVAWSTFTTGTNPGGHGIFDFLSRDPNTYLPILALSRYEQKNAFLPPKVVNLRRGTPFWELLSQAGISSTVLRCPCTYPPDQINGHMLAGVGVPDLRGGLGTSTFYTSQEGVVAEHSEKVITISRNDDGLIQTHLIGPRNPKTRADFHLDIFLEVDTRNNRITLRSQDTQPASLEINPGVWSEWLKVKFKLGLLQSVHGAIRFYLRQIDPIIELYASPINFDAKSPLFPISYPPEFSSELEGRLGTYYTIGMAEEHDGLIYGRFDEDAYLEQCNLVMNERRKMMLTELNRFTGGFFFCLFDTPDRLQHMFWRFHEKEHPANQGEYLQDYQAVIDEHYVLCDEIIGQAMEFANDKSLFIVLSDHGMSSFQRGLNLNTWLYENGFLVLKNDGQPGDQNGDFFRNVDWDQTKAYALGLGGIFLNLKGREANGIVEAKEVEQIKKEISSSLISLIDPKRKVNAITSVITREQVYSGPYINEAPDLIINFTPGYRVSWGTPLGGIPSGLFEDNIKRWAGDHVVDPASVPGVLFMNRPFDSNSASLVDLAPTILEYLGVSKGIAMEGRNLLR